MVYSRRRSYGKRRLFKSRSRSRRSFKSRGRKSYRRITSYRVSRGGIRL